VPLVGSYFDQQVRTIEAQLSVESKKAEVAEASEGLNLAIKAGIGLVVALGAVSMLTYINYLRVQTKAVAAGT
jgi:cell division protein FtsX